MILPLVMTYETMSKLVESVLDKSPAKLDLQPFEELKVKELLRYLREYPDEVIYLDVDVDEDALREYLESQSFYKEEW